MKIQTFYLNWKKKRDKELADKIAKQDPLIKTELKILSRSEWRNECNVSYYIDRNYKGYYDQRIF